MKINDILGAGKILPIDKLIDIISNSVGRISKPYFDRKDIDSKAYEITKIAEARAQELKIISNAINENFKNTGGIEYNENGILITSPKESQQTVINIPTIEERVEKRISFQEVKKQLNIETITAFAAEELKNEESVTDEPLDKDWTTRFFRIAEDISNEEMQAIWGRILAGEIKQPKSYSLRTLELIRNLSKEEADLFIRVANFSIKSSGTNFIYKGNDEKILSTKYNISYIDIARLVEIGLIQPGDFVKFELKEKSIESQRIFTSGNIIILAKTKANTPTIQIPIDLFSTSGNELLNLIKTNPPFDYLKAFANSIKNENIDLKYAYIISYEGTNINHSLPLLNFE